METLELPVVEEEEEGAPWQEQDAELAALQLWREASLPDNVADESAPAVEG